MFYIKQKQTFLYIFAGVAIILAILPAVVMFGSILTELFNRMHWYQWLQHYVLPLQARMVAVIIDIVGIGSRITPESRFTMVLIKNQGYIPVTLEWNCLGWQSLVLLFITFITGLRGNYSVSNKIQVLLFGVLGTIIINLLRMAFIITLAFYWSEFAATIVHDYLAMMVSLLWLLFFWWFSYSYILVQTTTSKIPRAFSQF